jgi:hypothetical protein
MTTLNYISQKLLNRVTDINSRLSEPINRILITKTEEIIKHLVQYDSLSFKKYGELNERNYRIISSIPIVLTEDMLNGVFDITPTILAKLNIIKTINLTFNSTIININIYHNSSDDETILNSNINKLITRLWNLLVLFENKKSSSKRTTYKWYLYDNVKRGNKNMTGSDYFENLNISRCFNSVNGLTDDRNSSISRVEESIGLLTHEFLHVINLNNDINPMFIENFHKNNQKLNWKKEKKIERNGGLSTLEMYTNAFAAIFNSYLISKEIDLNLEEVIKNEIIYSIINAIRMCKIQNTNLEKIYNRSSTNIVEWWEEADIYEYIIGKFLILLNFNSLSEGTNGPEFITNQFSRTKNFDHIDFGDQFAKQKIRDFHNRNDVILTIYNEISALEETYLSSCDKCRAETTTVCGHMIMQYFLYDPITIQPSQIIPNLYGGDYKEKYLKYKLKYMKLKKLFK